MSDTSVGQISWNFDKKTLMNPSSNAICERGFADKMLTESPIGHHLIHCSLNQYSRLAGEIYYCICVGFYTFVRQILLNNNSRIKRCPESLQSGIE